MNDQIEILQTPSGLRFGSLGGRRKFGAPTLLVVGSDLEYSLGSDEINQAGALLKSKGFACFALDVPGHGMNIRKGEPAGLEGWRERLDRNEDFVSVFNEEVRGLIDYLISEGYSDPRRIALSGTSRGGFMGLHAMAADTRIRCAAAFAPVVELPMLDEFKGLENHPLTQSLALGRLADRFAGRPLWICIGNNDQRVGTDSVITFSRQVVAGCLAANKPAPVELHVMQTDGHRIHETAHEEACAWFTAQLHP